MSDLEGRADADMGLALRLNYRCAGLKHYYSYRRATKTKPKRRIKIPFPVPMPSYRQMVWALEVCVAYRRGENIKMLGPEPPTRTKKDDILRQACGS